MLSAMLLSCLLVVAAPIDVVYHGPKEPGAAKAEDFTVPQWDGGATLFVAEHETNLRKAASAEAESVARLQLAGKVTIIERSSAVSKSGDRADYWYEVSTETGARGFVFGAALTPAGFVADLDDDGDVEGATVAWSPDYKVRVRYRDAGAVKQLDLQAGGQAYACCGGAIHVTLVSKEVAGLTLLRIDSDAEACGDYNSALVSFKGGEPLAALESGGLRDTPNYSVVSFEYAPKKQQLTVVRKTWSEEEGSGGEKASVATRERFTLKDRVFKSVKTGKNSD